MLSTVALALAGVLAGPAQCESLKSLRLPNAAIESAQLVPAGPFTPPAFQGAPPPANVAPPNALPDGPRGRGRSPGAAGGGVGARAGGSPAPPAMLPAHCRVAALLTPSPDSHIEMELWMPAALERWRETGAAPDHVVASHVANNRVDMTRPLCPYPQVAQYKGAGTPTDAANFVCKAP